MTEAVDVGIPNGQLLLKLVKAQAKFSDAATDRFNSHLKNNYATFGSILDAVRPALAEQGLYLTFDSEVSDNLLTVVAFVIEPESGGVLEARVHYPFNLGWTPQQVNAAVTYGKKAALLELFAITSTEELDADDDGESVSTAPAPATEQQVSAIREGLVRLTGKDDASLQLARFNRGSLEELLFIEAEAILAAISKRLRDAAKGAK